METDVIELLVTISVTAAAILFTYATFVGWFFAYAYARKLQHNGVDFHKHWVVYPMYIFLAFGALLDILFNWTVGSLIFLEFPREFFFTSRVKRWVKEADRRDALEAKRLDLYRYDQALEWKVRINKVEPDHI